MNSILLNALGQTSLRHTCLQRLGLFKVPLLAAGLIHSFAIASTGEQQKALFAIYKDLVETNTVHPNGDNTKAAQLAADYLRKGGFSDSDIRIVEPAPKKGNLVARMKGTGEKKPVLLLAHIDVVDAKQEDWGTDPFKLVERDGYYYGRGTIDDKAMAAGFVHALIRLKKEGYKPKRDIILALTADEEGGTHNGVAHLLEHHRELIDAEYALNEGGAGVTREGKPWFHSVQGSEKMYLSFEFEATNVGGHSSRPVPDNAIYDLSRALDRLSKYQFPVKLSFSMKMFFNRVGTLTGGKQGEAMVALASGKADDSTIAALASDPTLNAQMRTTCVATRLEGGHADNALPQRAKATVNCRLLPGENPDNVMQQLQKVANPEGSAKVSVKMKGEARASPESSSEAEPYKIITQVSESMWPGVPVVPSMSAGATDGMRLRLAGIPTYGASGMFIEFGENRLHGKDERIGVKAFYDTAEFLYRAVKALSQ
jgi:acetylornithine deacetylase/succinyl-diaminopimelate desuccinylase-like protein